MDNRKAYPTVTVVQAQPKNEMQVHITVRSNDIDVDRGGEGGVGDRQ